MGGISKDSQEKILRGLGVAAGIFAKKFGDYAISKQTVVTDPKKIELIKDVTMGVEVIGGAALAFFVDHPFVEGAGMGLSGTALWDALKRVGIPLPSVGEVDRRTLVFPNQNRPGFNGIEANRKNALGQGQPGYNRGTVGRMNVGNALTRARKYSAASM
jgi:hypothetical protein